MNDLSLFYRPIKKVRNFTQLKVNLKYYIKIPKYIYQRAKYGLCERDTWDFDYTLAKITAAGLVQLANTSNSYPHDKDSFEDWRDDLISLAKKFDYISDGAFNLNEDYNIDTWAEILERFEREKYDAFDTLATYFGDLWD